MKKCSKCNGYLILRNGIYGKFYGCSNFPQCKFTVNINKNIEKSNVKINDIVKLYYYNEQKIEYYKIITTVTENIYSFDRFALYGAIYNVKERTIIGSDPSDLENPSISSVSPLGKKLIGKSIDDIVEIDNHKYKILDILRNGESVKEIY